METPIRAQAPQEVGETQVASAAAPELRWVVAEAERKRTVAGLLARTWTLWLFLGIVALVVVLPSSPLGVIIVAELTEFHAIILAGVAAVLLSLSFFALTLRFTPIGKYSYRMHEGGIDVELGFRKRSYAWHNFLAFYDRSTRSRPNATKEELPALIAHERAIYGTAIYLRKQQVLYGSVFLMVYTKPENTEAVRTFLLDHVEEKPFVSEKDFRLARYEFR